MSSMSSEKGFFVVALALMVIGITGCLVASAMFDFLLLLAFAEMTSVSMFSILILCLIPSYFPRKINAESIFYCGLAKEPYMDDEVIYRPNVPLLNAPYDTNWDEYYDKSYVRVEREDER